MRRNHDSLFLLYEITQKYEIHPESSFKENKKDLTEFILYLKTKIDLKISYM